MVGAMKKSCIKGLVSLVCNAAVIALTVVCVARFFTSGGEGNMSSGGGFSAFRFFTVDSNVLAALSALFVLPWSFRAMLGSNRAMRHRTLLFKYVGACATTLTMLTVFFFLGPKYGYGAMLVGNNLYMHLITPLLMLVSLVCTENKGDIAFRETLYGLVPTALYGAVYIFETLIVGGWDDFYGFNAGGRWYVFLPVMLAASYLICVIVRTLHRVSCGIRR